MIHFLALLNIGPQGHPIVFIEQQHRTTCFDAHGVCWTIVGYLAPSLPRKGLLGLPSGFKFGPANVFGKRLNTLLFLASAHPTSRRSKALVDGKSG
jgi:hypothetical protein